MSDELYNGQTIDELSASAHRAEADELLAAQAGSGGLKVEAEQAGYQKSIDAHRDAGGSATAPAAAQPGFLSKAKTALVNYETHPLDTAEHGWNGVMSAAQELLITGDELASNIPGYQGLADLTGSKYATHDQFADYMRSDKNVFGAMKIDASKDNSAGNLIEGVTHFVAAKAALFSSGEGEASLAVGAAKNIGTMAAAFNPHDPHLADLLGKFPTLDKIIPDALKAHADDSEWEGRLKSALDGVGFEVAGKVVGGLVSWIKGVRGVQGAAADQKAIENAAPLKLNSANPTPEVKPDVTTAAGKDKPGAAAPEGTSQERFMADFDKLPDHETEIGHKRIGGTAVDIAKDPFDENTVHLNTIRADETGKGLGPAALKEITAMADKHGTHVTLDAIPMDKDAITKDALSDFYAKQGFKPTEGGLVEGRAMKREPNQGEPQEAWTPAQVLNAGTAKPTAMAGTGGNVIASPAAVAAKMLTPVSKEQGDAVMKALNEGRYLDVPNMLDDTHRTINWDAMSDGANMKGLFNAVEDHMGTMIKAAHGVQPMARSQVQQMANALGGDVNVLSRLYNGVTGENGLASRIMAGYNIMLAAGRQLKDLAGKARDLDASTPEGAQAVLDFQKQLQLHAGIVGQVRGASQEIGRALWAHRYLKANADVSLSGISEYAGTQYGTDTLKKLAKQIADSDDLRAMTNAADQLRGKGWKGILQEVAQNGMLSGPTTQVTNIVGNVGNALLKVGERYVAAGIGSARSVVAPSADVATFREAWAHTMGSYDGLKKGAQLAWQAIKNEDFTSKFSPATSRAIQMSTEGLDGATATYAQVVNAVGKVIRWPGRFMGLFDHFTQSVGYEGDLSARSYVQAAKEADAKGLMDDARDSFMGTRMADLRANPTTEMEQGAMAAGKYSAFLEDPATKFGGNLMKAFNSAPIIKLLVAPFIHRPGNMLRQGIGDYTAIAPLFDKNRAALTAGGSSTDLQLARMAIGTGTVLGSYEFATQGKLVGQRLGNKNTESLDGVPPYSAQIGSRWFKFDRLDPVGLWLGLGADLHEAIQHHYDPNDPDSTHALTKAATSAVQAISHVAMDKSFMKSVEDVTSALSEKDPARADILAEKLLSDNVAKLLPFSGLGRAIAHGTDDSARVSNGSGSLFDGAVASIPYLSQDLPARKDLLGRPVPAQSWWNPFNGAPANTDKMDQELSKLALNINAPSRTINGYTLNSKEWDEVIRNATQTPIIGGMKLEGALRALTTASSWDANAQAPDGGQLRNGGYAQSLIDRAYGFGRDMYLRDHPSFNEQKQTEALARFKASIVQYNQPTQAQPQAIAQ